MKTTRAVLLLLLVVSIPAFADCVPNAAWCSGNYLYDGMGNIYQIGADVYGYDTVGRLVSGTADYQRSGVLSRQNYAYDAYGNRTSAWRDPNSTGCDVTCELNRTILSGTNRIAGATYDPAGNLTSIQDVVNNTTYAATYDYDGLGMMTHAVAANGDDRQFVYTADDERIAIRQGVSWTWTIRGADAHVLREFTSGESNGLPTSGFQWLKDYVYRDGALLASKSSDTATALHFHLDHLGTPRVVTNDSGSIVGIHAYYAFGSELTLTPREPTQELLKFTGHERDQLGGDPHTLDDMHARYYSANLGRFLSVDPVIDVKLAMVNPQGWNRYSYVLNNPVNHTDPTGKCTDVETCAWSLLQSLGPMVVRYTAREASTAILTAAKQYSMQRLSNFTYAKPQVIPTALAEAQDKPPDAKSDAKSDDQKAGAQDKKLSGAEIDAMEEHGVDVHELKADVTGDKKVSKYDLFKDKDGNIYVKPKNDRGQGEPTGLNIKDYTRDWIKPPE